MADKVLIIFDGAPIAVLSRIEEKVLSVHADEDEVPVVIHGYSS